MKTIGGFSLTICMAVTKASEQVYGTGKDHPDYMPRMPDVPDFKTNTYSGYLRISDTKQLHYTFTESQSDDKAKDPVVVWFQGGPGCSSMLGFLQESGPYVVDDGESHLKENPWPWNKRANVAYIESPAGVGYSFATGPGDKQQNDMQSAQDNYKALISFYEKFPNFRSHPLYIAGESYAGIYVPYLSWVAFENNKYIPFDEQMNIEGFIVGNGATDFHYDIWPSYNDVIWGKQMITTKLHDDIVKHNCTQYFHNIFPSNNLEEPCRSLWNKLQENTLWSNINWYDLYRPTQVGGLSLDQEDSDPADHKTTRPLKGEERMTHTYVHGEKKEYKIGYTPNERTPWLKGFTGEFGDNTLGNYVSHYMNREDVRDAMHIPVSAPAWTTCSNDIAQGYKVGEKGSIWVYPILRNEVKILFYCGDTDGAVPCWGTRQWMKNDLNWDIKEETRPYYLDGQFQGEITQYDGMDFVTVHGVGHLAPQWKRESVTKMITAWLHDEPI